MPFVSRPRRRRGPPIGGPYPGLTTQRNLINFRAVMQSRIETEFDLQAGDVVDFWHLMPTGAVSTPEYLMDGSGTQRPFLRFNTGGTWNFNSSAFTVAVDGSAVTDGSSFPVDGRLHRMTVTMLAPGTLTRIGARFNDVETLNRFIYDFTVTRSSTVVLDYPLDDTLINSNVIRNSAATLGSELSTAADPLTSNPIGGSAFSFYPIGNIVSGNTYILEADVSGYQGSGDVGFRSAQGVNLGGGVRVIQADGRIHIIFEATGTGSVDFFTQSSNQCIFSNTTLREAPGYGTAFGLGAGDSEPYTDLPAEFVQVANTALISSTDVLGDNANPEFSPNVLAVATGNRYRISATISTVNGTPTNNAGWSSAGGVPATAPFRLTGTALAVGAVIGGDFDAINNDSIRLFGRSNAQIALSSIETRRVLRKEL